jgi:hypothetical protein
MSVNTRTNGVKRDLQGPILKERYDGDRGNSVDSTLRKMTYYLPTTLDGCTKRHRNEIVTRVTKDLDKLISSKRSRTLRIIVQELSLDSSSSSSSSELEYNEEGRSLDDADATKELITSSDSYADAVKIGPNGRSSPITKEVAIIESNSYGFGEARGQRSLGFSQLGGVRSSSSCNGEPSFPRDLPKKTGKRTFAVIDTEGAICPVAGTGKNKSTTFYVGAVGMIIVEQEEDGTRRIKSEYLQRVKLPRMKDIPVEHLRIWDQAKKLHGLRWTQAGIELRRCWTWVVDSIKNNGCDYVYSKGINLESRFLNYAGLHGDTCTNRYEDSWRDVLIDLGEDCQKYEERIHDPLEEVKFFLKFV